MAIEVTALGDAITRGIFRDFPTIYRDDGGLSERLDLPVPVHVVRRTVPFEVVGVQRDGRPEAFHTETQENGVRVYAGRADAPLPPGRYERGAREAKAAGLAQRLASGPTAQRFSSIARYRTVPAPPTVDSATPTTP
jgi:hypothetical protein